MSAAFSHKDENKYIVTKKKRAVKGKVVSDDERAISQVFVKNDNNDANNSDNITNSSSDSVAHFSPSSDAEEEKLKEFVWLLYDLRDVCIHAGGEHKLIG